MMTKVEWTEFASNRWQEVAEDIFQEFGYVSLQKFAEATESWIQRVGEQPTIGAYEPLLRHRKIQYRHLIITKLTKLIYYIENDTVIIVHVWDTRREPIKLDNEIF